MSDKELVECDMCGKKFREDELRWTQDPFVQEMSMPWEQEGIPYQWMCSECYETQVGEI